MYESAVSVTWCLSGRFQYRLKVTPVNLEKKMLAEPLMSSEDSSEMDMQSLRAGNAWPIMELAVSAAP